MRSVLLLLCLLAVGYCNSTLSSVNQTNNSTPTDATNVTSNSTSELTTQVLTTVSSSPVVSSISVTCNQPEFKDCDLTGDPSLWMNCNNDCTHLGMHYCSQCFAPNCSCNATAAYELMVSQDNQCMYQRSCTAAAGTVTESGQVDCQKTETLLAAVACWIVSILLIILLIHCRSKYIKDKREMVELIKVMDNIKRMEERSEMSEVSSISVPPLPAGMVPGAIAMPGRPEAKAGQPVASAPPADGLGTDSTQSAASAKDDDSLSFDESNQLKNLTKKMKREERKAKKERKRWKKKRRRKKMSKSKSLRDKKKKDKAAVGTFASELKYIDPAEMSMAEVNPPPQPPLPPENMEPGKPDKPTDVPQNEPQPTPEQPTPASHTTTPKSKDFF